MIYLEILFILVLTVMNGLLAMSELAIVSSRRSRLEQLAQTQRGARAAIRLMDDPGKFLSTVQIGITAVGILAGAYGGATLAEHLAPWLDQFSFIAPHGDSFAIGIVVLCITYLSLIVGELVPKRIAMNNPEAIAVWVALPMLELSRVAAPAVWLLRKSTEGILKFLGQNKSTAEPVSEEEVKSLIAEGTRAGTFEPQEKEMIEGVLRLADRTARTIMTPRTEIFWLDPNDDAAEMKRELEEAQYSRLLVCEGSVDHAVGTVKTKDILAMVLAGNPISLRTVMAPPMAVPDNVPLLRLLDLFRREGVHMAVVVDDHGITQGLVTTTDILETIAGNLPERGEESGPSMIERTDGTWLVDGSLPMDELQDRLGLRGLMDAGNFETIAGFVLHHLQHLPVAGEKFDAHNCTFEVLDMDGRRIDKVLVRLPRHDDIFMSADAKVYLTQGNTLSDQGRLAEAEQAFRAAIKLKPDFVYAHFNLGNTLARLGRLADAEAAFATAAQLKPDLLEAHFNLGRILFDQSKMDEALASYRRAFDLSPGNARIAGSLGALLLDAGRTDEARAAFSQAAQMGTEKFAFRLRAEMCLPRIAASATQIRETRARLAVALTSLQDADGIIDNPPEALGEVLFYLAYAGENDRALMEAAHQLLRKHAPVLNYVSPHLTERPRRSRIAVGFLSQYLCHHTIGKLNKGFIAHLDRTQFEVTVIHTNGTRQDAMRAEIDSLADHVVILPADLGSAQQAVAELKLDVLHYPDIGMSAFTYFLGYARLAPVQCVTWGHPDTTGLSTMDYFLSFAAAEPENAAQHYTETLVPMARPNVFYAPDALITEPVPRADFGLPTTGNLYGCLQSLFKFHPDFDAVLADIVARDPTGWIVAVDGTHPAWRQALHDRWANQYPTLPERVIFHPRLPEERFKRLVRLMDVMVDPVHFGGGNTFYEALAQGVPSVTWPGHFFRGRIITGLCRLMGADDLVVEHPADLAPRAVALATNRPQRDKLVRELQAKAHVLYSDRAAVQEFEAFLSAAVKTAQEGRKVEDWI